MKKLFKRINFMYKPLRRAPVIRLLPTFLQKTITLLVSISIILGTPGMLYLFNPLGNHQAEAAWYDDSWAYRQRIDVSNAGSAQTNFQVSFTLNTSSLVSAGQLQSSCNDLRITDSNGKVLPYWIEQMATACSSNTAQTIWVKVPSIPAAASGNTEYLYVYYGNPSAASYSDGNRVFDFFDDFSTSTLDSTKWQSTGSNSISGGALTITTGSVYSKNTIESGSQNYIYESRQSWTNPAVGSVSGLSVADAQGLQGSNAGGNKNMLYLNNGGNAAAWASTNGASGYNVVSGTTQFTPTAATNYIFSMSLDSTNIKYYQNRSATNTYVATWSAAPYLYLGYYQGNQSGTSDGNDAVVDWVLSRKYAATAPSTSVDATVNKATAPIAYWRFDDGSRVVATNSVYKSNSTITNLVLDPSTDGNTWSYGSGHSLVTEKSIFGSSSIKAVVSAQSVASTSTCIANLSPSTAYTYSAWIYRVSGFSGSTSIDIIEYSGTNCDVSQVLDGVNPAVTTTDTWIRDVDAITTTASTHSVKLRFVTDGPATGTAYFDGAQFETGALSNNYCDGSLTGSGTNSWSGTTNASASTCSKGNNGMIHGGTWQTEDQCVSGKCLYLSGSTPQYVSSPDLPYYTFSNNAFTLSAWIRTKSSSSQAIISQYNGGVAGGILLRTSSGVVTYHDGSSLTVTGTKTVNDNRWHFVQYVQASNTDHKIYVDGVLDVSSSSTGVTPDSSYPLQIGASLSSSSPQELFAGTIDEVKIYNFNLASTQIVANYDAKTNEGGSVLGANRDNSSALSNGLVAYYKMDESSANTCTGGVNDSCDSSGNSNNGAWNGTNIASAPGKFGNGVSLNGTDDYISAANTSSLDPGTGDISVSVWVNPDTLTDNQTGIVKYLTGNTYYILEHNDNDTLVLEFRDGTCSAQSFSTSATLTASTWNHVVLTIDRDKQAAIYINGGTPTTSTVVTNCQASMSGGTIAIGRHVNYFDGVIDEARIYNRALSPTEIQTLYNFAPGPFGYWKLDEKAGTTINDSSGNSGGGTLTTGASGTQTASSQAWKPGKFGGALNFDGTDDYVDITKTWPVTNNNFSVSAWIYDTGDRTSDIIYDGSAGRVAMEVASSNLGCLTNNDAWKTGGSISANVWTHVACVYDGTNMNGYINGVLAFSTSDNAPTADVTAMTISGNTNHGFEFPGLIDDVKVYNYARTAGQVIEDMNGGHPLGGSPVGSPVGYWKFNEGADDTCSGGTNDACNSGSAGSTLDGAETGMAVPAISTSGWTNAGKFGKALNFDRTNDIVTVSDNDALDFNSGEGFTITAWINPVDSTNHHRIVQKGNPFNVGGQGYSLLYRGDNSPKAFDLQINDTTLACDVTSSSVGSLSGTWSYVAVAVDQTALTVKFYLNGSLVSSTSLSGCDGDLRSASNFIIGGSGSFYGGGIDEVKIYRAPLTSDQVKIDMNQGQSQILGATSDNTSYEKRAANQAYCVPGDSATCVAPTAQYDFEEGSGTSPKNTGTNGVNGTLNNGPAYSPGKVGKAMSFTSASSQDMTTGTTLASFITNTDSTMEAWIYPTGTAPSSTNVYDLGAVVDDVQAYQGIYVGNDTDSGGDKIWVLNYDGTNDQVGVSYSRNVWTHVVLVHTGGNLYIYTNGVLGGSTASGTTGSLANNLKVGSRNSSSYFNGKIDQVRTYNYARSAAQVAWDYNQGAPLAWWKFDECQGTTINDSSGNGNTGTWSGTGSGVTVLGTCAVPTGAWYNGVNGKRNASLSFDGSDDFVTTTQLTSGNSFTWNVWVYPTAVSNDQMFLGPYTAGGVSSAYYFRLNSSKAFVSISSTVAQRTLAGSTTLSNNTWYLLTAVYDGVKLYLYVNGVLDATGSTLNESLNPWGVGRIGRWIDADQRPFTGKLDDIRLYNYAMTPTQIKTLYNGGAASYIPVTGTP